MSAPAARAGAGEAAGGGGVTVAVEDVVKDYGPVVHTIGDKGLNLVFSDGHGRGIYPWAYLRELGEPGTA